MIQVNLKRSSAGSVAPCQGWEKFTLKGRYGVTCHNRLERSSEEDLDTRRIPAEEVIKVSERLLIAAIV